MCAMNHFSLRSSVVQGLRFKGLPSEAKKLSCTFSTVLLCCLTALCIHFMLSTDITIYNGHSEWFWSPCLLAGGCLLQLSVIKCWTSTLMLPLVSRPSLPRRPRALVRQRLLSQINEQLLMAAVSCGSSWYVS